MNQVPKTILTVVITAVVVAVIAVGGTVWYYQNKDSDNSYVATTNNTTHTTSDQDNSSSSSDVQSLGMYNTKDYDYDVVTLESSPVQQQLTRVRVGSSKTETLLNNAALEKALPDLADTVRPKLLVEVSEPTSSRYVYYTIVLDGTEDTGSSLYEFNADTLTFRKMNVSEGIVKNIGGLTFIQKLSSDGNKLALVNNLDGKKQDLYVVNLATDTLTNLVSLSGNESFEGGEGGLSSFTEIKWNSNTELSYDVFDVSQKESHFPDTNQEFKKVATRTVEVK